MDSLAKIKILLLPIGNISPKSFEYFKKEIYKFDEIHLHNLSRFQQDILKSPFKRNNWSSGKLLIEYLEEKDEEKNVHGIIGIIHCSVEEDIYQVYKKYLENIKQYSQSLLNWCFAFNPMENQNFENVKDFMIFPNQKDRLGDYIEVQINNLGAELLKEFEKKSQEKVKDIPLEKTFGDYSLLSGSYQDSLFTYQSLIETSKQNNLSPIIYASCLQGICTCYYLLYSYDYYQNIMDYYQEMIQIYESKGLFDLQVKSLLKLAHFNKKKSIILSFISQALFKSEKFPILDRIKILIETSEICYKIKSFRKYGYILLEISNLYKQLKKEEKSFYYKNLILKSFDIPLEFKNNLWEFKMTPKRGWEMIQIQYLKDFIILLKDFDKFQCIQIIHFLLFYYSLNESDQLEIYKLIQDLNNNNLFDSILSQLNIIQNISIQPLHSNLKPIQETIEKVSLFYYNPFEKEKKLIHYFSKGDFIYFNIELKNDFYFPLIITKLKLLINGEVKHFYLDTKIIIPKKSKINYEMMIQTLNQGNIEIYGIQFILDEMKCISNHHLIQPFSIQIIDELPFMEFSSNHSTISLIHNETIKLNCLLKNKGKLQIDEIKIDYINLSKCKIKLESIQQKLPLKDVLSFDIEILGIYQETILNHFELKIKYKSILNPQWYRQIIFPFQIQIHPGLKYENLSNELVSLYNDSNHIFKVNNSILLTPKSKKIILNRDLSPIIWKSGTKKGQFEFEKKESTYLSDYYLYFNEKYFKNIQSFEIQSFQKFKLFLKGKKKNDQSLNIKIHLYQNNLPCSFESFYFNGKLHHFIPNDSILFERDLELILFHPGEYSLIIKSELDEKFIQIKCI